MMNLLPKTHEEFSQENYWDSFFKKRGHKSFEWYGEFIDLCFYLFKYIKSKDEILIVGCGNSNVSVDLYDAGYRNISNIDISAVVINQMQKENEKKRPELQFQRMDATQMDFPDGKFSVVLDKGTLDALMTNTDEETISRIDKFFHEIQRVLRSGGRYICISLLQDYIAKKLIKDFSIAGFMIRVTRCIEAEANKSRHSDSSNIPVFIIIATKFTKAVTPIFEITLSNEAPKRLNSADDLLTIVKSIQESAAISNTLSKATVAKIGEVSLDLHRAGESIPRYTLYIVENPKIKCCKTFGAFVVPQGRESEWLFSTKEGRMHLLKAAYQDRLVVVILHKQHTYGSIDNVKVEIEDSIRNLAPVGLSGNQIVFLSLGDDSDKKTVCYRGNSEMSGPYIIEDTEIGDSIFRRLIFSYNPSTIQSEARLKIGKTRRGNNKKIIDPGYLSCTHHIYMSVGVSLIVDSDKNTEILIIGLGGGNLCTFLIHCFSKLKIIAAEIDGEMLRIAREFFGLIQTNNLKVEITDGLKFLQECADKGKQFSAILFDVDNKDVSMGMSCPPEQFIEIPTLNLVSQCLTEDGIFILNLVIRNKALKKKVMENLKKVFKMISCCSIPSDVNEVIVASVKPCENSIWIGRLGRAASSLNDRLIKKNVSTKDVLDVNKLLEDLKLET